jgi:hypothetical protein
VKITSRQPRVRVLALTTTVATGMLWTVGGVGAAHAATTVVAEPTVAQCAAYALCYRMDEPKGGTLTPTPKPPGTPMLDSSPNHLNSIKIMPGITRDGSSYYFSKTGSVIAPNKPAAQVGTRNFIITVQLHLDPLPQPCSEGSCSQNFFQKGGFNIDPSHGQWKLEMSGTHVHCRIFGDQGEASVWYFGVGKSLTAGSGSSYWHTLTCSRIGNQVKLTVDGKSTNNSWNKNVLTGNVVNPRNVTIGGKGQGCGTDCDYTQGFINFATLQYLP